MSDFHCSRAALFLGCSLFALAASAADTWYWLGKVSCNDFYGGTSRYGYAYQSPNNWRNKETGANGVPKAGDFIVVDTRVSSTAAYFGSDFSTSVAFGGLTYATTPAGNSSNQGTQTFLAGGPGIVSNPDVTLNRDTHKFNSNIYFLGSGDAVVDIPAGTLYVQKALCGNADITLVKRGAGTLKHSEGYAPLNTAKTAYVDPRNYYGNYYPNRKFVFGGVKLQGGHLDMCQYYWVSNCDFQFDGNGVILGLKKFDNNGGADRGVHSLEFQNCKLRETANVTTSDHQVYGDDARCYLHMFGAMEDTSFSGRFTQYAGLVWEPTDPVEFNFRKGVSTTAGKIEVLNGTVRVSDGASFPNLATVTVSGAGSRFRVDADAIASFPKADASLVNGGKLRLGTATSFKSLTVDGTALAAGIYCGPDSAVKNAAATAVDWIEGSGHVVLGALPAEADAVAVTWNGTGAATTLENWSGAEALPALADGSAQVAVAGGSSFVADVDAWVKGFTLNAGPFTLAADSGKTLWIGSAGLVNSANGAVTVGDGNGAVVVAGAQTWNMGAGSLTVNGPIAATSGETMWIKGNGGKALDLNAATPDWTCPVVITNMLVNFNVSGALGPKSAGPAFLMGEYKPSGSPNGSAFADDIVIDRPLWFGYTKGFSCSAGKTLTFNGAVCSTNTQSLNVTAPAGARIVFNDLFMSRDGGSLQGDGTIVFNGPCHFRDRPSMSGNVTVELHVPGNRLNGNLGTFSGGRIKTMAPYVITKANTRRQPNGTTGNSGDNSLNTIINSKNDFVLDLNGFDQSIDQLCMHASGAASGGHVTSETAAALHLQTTKSWLANHNYGYGFGSGYKTYSSADGYGFETADKGFWEGGATISYEADPGMVRSMMRTSSTTGNVEVLSGTLVFLRRAKTAGETFDLKDGTANPYGRLADEDGAWPNASKVIVKGGVLKLEHSKAFGKDVALELSSAGKLQLEAGVRLKCASLTLDGEEVRSGAYGSSESGAQKKLDAFFTGAGVVQVGTPGMALVIR